MMKRGVGGKMRFPLRLLLSFVMVLPATGLMAATRPAGVVWLGGYRMSARVSATSMNLLRQPGERAAIESMLAQAKDASGIVTLYFTSREYFLSTGLVERTAKEYASSMLYGGPSCAVIELSLPESNEAYELAMDACRQVGVTEVPCAMVWSKGELMSKVAPADLEGVLLQLGARSASKKTNERKRDFGSKGGISGTAVDEIDFTGGAGNKGRPNLDWGLNQKGKSDAGRTTADRFPSWFGGTDKPGDGMKGNEPPGSARQRKEKDRDDRPPGFDGRD